MEAFCDGTEVHCIPIFLSKTIALCDVNFHSILYRLNLLQVV